MASVQVKVETKAVVDLLKRLELHVIEKAERELLRQIEAGYVDAFRRQAPVRTGKLKASIRAERRTALFSRILYAKHGVYTDKGVRPHIIRARPGGVLRWLESSLAGDAVRFAKSVKHPGIAPMRWVDLGRQMGRDRMRQTLKEWVSAHFTFEV